MKHAIGLICLVAAIYSAADPSAVEADNAQPVTAALSGETRALLIREMQAVAEAMGRIHTAMVTGDHATVESAAGNIHDNFVLAQEITPEQRHEIADKLPAEFIAADRAFHDLAALLASAGEEEDPRLERLWFQEMTRACQGCHEDHGGGRFPGLVQDKGDAAH